MGKHGLRTALRRWFFACLGVVLFLLPVGCRRLQPHLLPSSPAPSAGTLGPLSGSFPDEAFLWRDKRPVKRRAEVQLPPPPAVLALEFHHVLPQAVLASHPALRTPQVIAAEELDRDLAFLTREGFHSVDTAAVAEFVAGRVSLPPRSVFITFDDGYESVYQYAFPLFQKYRMHATLFVIAGAIRDQGGSFDPLRLSYLTWGELQTMVSSGLVDVQCHTFAMHEALRGVGPPPLLVAPEPEVEADLLKCRQVIEAHLGRPVFAFAYPHGAFSPAALHALRVTGYRIAFIGGSWPIYRGAKPLLLPRFFVHPGVSLHDLLRYVPPATPQQALPEPR